MKTGAPSFGQTIREPQSTSNMDVRTRLTIESNYSKVSPARPSEKGLWGDDSEWKKPVFLFVSFSV